MQAVIKSGMDYTTYTIAVSSAWDDWLKRHACPSCIARESCSRRRDVAVQRPRVVFPDYPVT